MTITPNIQAHLDFFKSLKNITKVELKPVPIQWKQKIGNIDCIMFAMYKENKYIDIVVPAADADYPVNQSFIENKDRLALFFNIHIDNDNEGHMTEYDDYVESFYYANPNTKLFEKIANITLRSELTSIENYLVVHLLTLPFVKEAYIYSIDDNPNFLVVLCNIINLTYTGDDTCILGNLYCPPHGTVHKKLVPVDVVNDLSKHKIIVDNVNAYYTDTVGLAQPKLYKNTLQPVIPKHLQDLIDNL